MEDILLHLFFEKHRWETAIQIAVQKGINPSLLRQLSAPETRMALYHDIKDRKYTIAPPHEAKIPKDDGTMRTVYVNNGIDRVLLSIFNDMLFELCPELIHPRCGSYQKGIGCGKLVKDMAARVPDIQQDVIGRKIDLSKYFDSVERQYIDEIFDYIDGKFGPSALTDTVRAYYHTDTVIDIEKNLITKYSSLRQGCAVAAFLANAVLYDIDKTISDMDVGYIRYSDDILIIGPEWQRGFDVLTNMLAEKNLILNPKKVETLRHDTWFTFLGFAVKNGTISLSPHRVKTFQKEIEKRTIRQPSSNISTVMHRVTDYLYRGNGQYSWATSVLPVITSRQDINTLNSYVMDAIRAAVTGKTRIGGLGVSKTSPSDGYILRGKGRYVRSNREKIPVLNNWYTLRCMKNAMATSMEAYHTLIATL